MDFTITWKGYACIKKVNGCCGGKCINCCYEPARVIDGNKKVRSDFLREFKLLTPENSPNLEFTQLSVSAQNEICGKLQNKSADKETWSLYFGAGKNIVK